MEDLVGTKAVAKALGISPRHVLYLAERGDIPCIVVGGGDQRTYRRFRLSQVFEALEARANRANESAA